MCSKQGSSDRSETQTGSNQKKRRMKNGSNGSHSKMQRVLARHLLETSLRLAFPPSKSLPQSAPTGAAAEVEKAEATADDEGGAGTAGAGVKETIVLAAEGWNYIDTMLTTLTTLTTLDATHSRVIAVRPFKAAAGAEWSFHVKQLWPLTDAEATVKAGSKVEADAEAEAEAKAEEDAHVLELLKHEAGNKSATCSCIFRYDRTLEVILNFRSSLLCHSGHSADHQVRQRFGRTRFKCWRVFVRYLVQAV